MTSPKKAKILDRESILAAEDLPSETVSVPEWNGSVIIRTMTGYERDKMEGDAFVGEGANRKLAPNTRARLLSLTAVDEDGNRLFSEEDIEAIGKKSSRVLDRLYDVAQRLSGIGVDDVEALEKN